MKTVLIFMIFLFISCSRNEPGKNTKSITDSAKSKSEIRKFDLSDGQKKVLDGAKKCLEKKFNYDITMGYYILTFKDGVNTGNKVFPGGDMDPMLGVCTEVIIRALRWGGVCDLQEEIYNDIKSNPADYPISRWGAKKPDPNIDQRRVPNQMVWFSKYWQEINASKESDFQPGDVVAWDMNGDGWGDHIGIVSDKYGPDETLMLIHNFPSPGYVAEEDVLNRWKIMGHYRVK